MRIHTHAPVRAFDWCIQTRRISRPAKMQYLDDGPLRARKLRSLLTHPEMTVFAERILLLSCLFAAKLVPQCNPLFRGDIAEYSRIFSWDMVA